MADLGALVLLNGPLRNSSFSGLLTGDQATELQVFSKDMDTTVVVWGGRNSII